jgi:hypothetical protein
MSTAMLAGGDAAMLKLALAAVLAWAALGPRPGPVPPVVRATSGIGSRPGDPGATDVISDATRGWPRLSAWLLLEMLPMAPTDRLVLCDAGWT